MPRMLLAQVNRLKLELRIARRQEQRAQQNLSIAHREAQSIIAERDKYRQVLEIFADALAPFLKNNG